MGGGKFPLISDPSGLVELTADPRLKTVGRFWLKLLKEYLRLEVEGVENLPRKGRAVILPNHSGFAGADAVLLTSVIKRRTRRRARLMAHRAFFDFSDTLRSISESHGLRKAGLGSGIEILSRDQLLIIFPEGETGNFKPTYKRYQLQRFHTGFLRMAIETRSPVVPTIIIGAEETHLSLGNINLNRWIKGLRIPIPLNFIPLPAKWKIVFLEPIPGDQYDPSVLEDPDRLREIAAELQKRMQRELRKQLKSRSFIYSRKARIALEKLIHAAARKAGVKPGRKRSGDASRGTRTAKKTSKARSAKGSARTPRGR